jgi:chromosome segregation ATPase
MNIDERLEAITTHLELLSHMQRDNESRFERVERNLDRLEGSVLRISQNVDRVVGMIAGVSEDIRSLARIAESHERRISDLEDNGAA